MPRSCSRSGFVVRPLGGWLFGSLADHYGRRSALMLSVMLMCFGSLMIAVTPTYASIGIAAPIVLGLARVIQGLSLGGEYGTSATYLTEMADERHRGFYSSFQYVTLIGGQLCALIVLLLLQKVFLTNDEIRAWGWRIPFVIGACLAVVAAVMRRNLEETEAFEASKKLGKRESSIRALLKYPREVLLVVGLTAGGTAAFYTYTTYMQKFLKLSVGLTDDQTTTVTAASLVFAMCLQPIYGAISDRIGRKWLLIGFGVSRRAVHHPDPHLAAGRLRPVRGVPPDRCGLDDRIRLYLDQCGGEGGAVSDQHPRHRRRRALCAHGLDLRRHRGFGRAVVQVAGARDLVLLLPDRNDRRFRSWSTCSCATPRRIRR